MSEKVLIAGSGGQLGTELQRTAPAEVEIAAMDLQELDISDLEQINAVIESQRPTVLINAAAYTAVDQAESDLDEARKANAQGPENLAVACQQAGIKLIHISTDFVFDGEKSTPYLPEDKPNPLGIYGKSKLVGEISVRNIMKDNGVIIRTGWVYSAHGNNFVKTMLRLMAEKEQLGIVADQVGTPTWARGLANCCWAAVSQQNSSGIYHWSDAGVCSWYDFAIAIQDIALEKGLLKKAISITPIATEDYPTPAKRPAYSVLSKARVVQELELSPQHWRHQLAAMLSEMAQS